MAQLPYALWGGSSSVVPQAMGAEDMGQPHSRAHIGFLGSKRRNMNSVTDDGKVANIPKVLEVRPARELYNMLCLSPETCLFISRNDLKKN